MYRREREGEGEEEEEGDENASRAAAAGDPPSPSPARCTHTITSTGTGTGTGTGMGLSPSSSRSSRRGRMPKALLQRMAVGILPSSSQILDPGRLAAYQPLTAVLSKQRRQQPRDADYHTTASAPPGAQGGLAPLYSQRRRAWARQAMWERLSLSEGVTYKVCRGVGACEGRG